MKNPMNRRIAKLEQAVQPSGRTLLVFYQGPKRPDVFTWRPPYGDHCGPELTRQDIDDIASQYLNPVIFVVTYG